MLLLKPDLRFRIMLSGCSLRSIIFSLEILGCRVLTGAERVVYGSHIIKLVSLQGSEYFATNVPVKGG